MLCYVWCLFDEVKVYVCKYGFDIKEQWQDNLKLFKEMR